jgi:hypothetical protein
MTRQPVESQIAKASATKASANAVAVNSLIGHSPMSGNGVTD